VTIRQNAAAPAPKRHAARLSTGTNVILTGWMPGKKPMIPQLARSAKAATYPEMATGAAAEAVSAARPIAQRVALSSRRPPWGVRYS